MLATLLGSETRAKVLTTLFAQPRRTYHLRELIRLAGGSASGVQREVARLEGLGLVTSERTSDGRRSFQVTDEHELLEPLRALVAVDAAQRARGARIPAAPAADRFACLHAQVRSRLPLILAVMRTAGVARAVLFGSATDPEASAEPRDLDVLIRLSGPPEGRATRYFELRRELERASGLPVDLVEEEAVTNPYLRDEMERTGVVILEAA